MKQEVLPRMKLDNLDECLLDARVQLAKDAQSILGYKKMANAIAVPDALAYTLRRLGIEPLQRASVDAYKAKKAVPGMWEEHRVGYWWLGGCAALCVGTVPALHALGWGNGNALQVAGSIVYTLGTLATGLVGLLYRFATDSKSRTNRSWRPVSLRGFEGSVPEHVLDKAVRLKTELPAVELSIDQLYETTERREAVRSPDPFLVARLGDECFYLDVWDEKEYESRL